ncbi:MAG: phosphoribosylglycinamide formyltransferase [Acidimicrobiales bacterium]
MRVAVLASGGGTILEAMLDQGVDIDLVVVDRVCGATDVAARHGVTARMVERSSFGADFDRRAYTAELTTLLVDHGIELVAMAGFGTILDGSIYGPFADRVLNTHPSLLPSFPGWHAVDDALAYPVAVTGCTVHVAVAEVDAGPILAQEAVPVLAGDTADTLHERIKTVERRLYPATLRAVIEAGGVAGFLNARSTSATTTAHEEPAS